MEVGVHSLGWHAALTGGLLAVALLKWGNPVTFEHLISPPENWEEFVWMAWPVQWAYLGLIIYGAASVLAFSWIMRPKPSRSREVKEGEGDLSNLRNGRWIVWLPLIWLFWQFAAALGTVEPELTRKTLFHFSGCVLLFYAGYFVLSQVKDLRLMWFPLLVAFAYVLWTGFGQRYGGLEAVREMVYERPDWETLSPEFLQRISSARIFSTLVYPNALAGALLLFSPALLVAAWNLTAQWPRIARMLAVGLLGYGAAACLIWSGSKSGWLIALILGVVIFLRQPAQRKTKALLLGCLLLVGMSGFLARYADYFQRGATSVVARFEYWRAAAVILKKNPVLGSGPGTFQVSYAKIKPPEAEMARLAHNDYVQQASDSGLPGFLAYFIFVVGSLGFLYGRCLPQTSLVRFAVWLGLLAWALQGLSEFSLYIPALAWPAFLWLGWLWGHESGVGQGRIKAVPERSD
jgi:O-antigen ligase